MDSTIPRHRAMRPADRLFQIVLLLGRGRDAGDAARWAAHLGYDATRQFLKEHPEIFVVTLDPARNRAAAYLRGTFDFVKVSHDQNQTRYTIGAEPFINRFIQPRIQYRINNGPPQPGENPNELVDNQDERDALKVGFFGREMVRQGRRELNLISHCGSQQLNLLAAVGAVRRVEVGF